MLQDGPSLSATVPSGATAAAAAAAASPRHRQQPGMAMAVDLLDCPDDDDDDDDSVGREYRRQHQQQQQQQPQQHQHQQRQQQQLQQRQATTSPTVGCDGMAQARASAEGAAAVAAVGGFPRASGTLPGQRPRGYGKAGGVTGGDSGVQDMEQGEKHSTTVFARGGRAGWRARARGALLPAFSVSSAILCLLGLFLFFGCRQGSHAMASAS